VLRISAPQESITFTCIKRVSGNCQLAHACTAKRTHPPRGTGVHRQVQTSRGRGPVPGDSQNFTSADSALCQISEHDSNQVSFERRVSNDRRSSGLVQKIVFATCAVTFTVRVVPQRDFPANTTNVAYTATYLFHRPFVALSIMASNAPRYLSIFIVSNVWNSLAIYNVDSC
jgi:hypothetical protein